MSARTPSVGIEHLTVVPTNFEPARCEDEDEDPDADQS